MICHTEKRLESTGSASFCKVLYGQVCRRGGLHSCRSCAAQISPSWAEALFPQLLGVLAAGSSQLSSSSKQKHLTQGHCLPQGQAARSNCSMMGDGNEVLATSPPFLISLRGHPSPRAPVGSTEASVARHHTDLPFLTNPASSSYRC